MKRTYTFTFTHCVDEYMKLFKLITYKPDVDKITKYTVVVSVLLLEVY